MLTKLVDCILTPNHLSSKRWADLIIHTLIRQSASILTNWTGYGYNSAWLSVLWLPVGVLKVKVLCRQIPVWLSVGFLASLIWCRPVLTKLVVCILTPNYLLSKRGTVLITHTLIRQSVSILMNRTGYGYNSAWLSVFWLPVGILKAKVLCRQIPAWLPVDVLRA